jgi:hypothetical protein
MHGLYQHFKGGLYLVHGITKHSETQEELVVYESLKTGETWVRPLSMFNETVEHNGQRVPRFEKLADAPEQPEPVLIDEQEEAAFVQDYLLQRGKGFISTEDIKLITEAQVEFLRSKGLMVEEGGGDTAR